MERMGLVWQVEAELERRLSLDLLPEDRASPAKLEELAQACYALGDAAHWDDGKGQWVRQDFALLRLAACTADRMGHVLLIQSLERAFRGMASWVLPLLD